MLDTPNEATVARYSANEALTAHGYSYLIGNVFFGLHLLVLGYLLF